VESRYLKTLVTAIDTGSFSQTAKKLNITQSAVSQRIKTMEEHYGLQLFDRSGSSLVPTEAGLIVLETAREILMLEQKLNEKLLRIGCNTGLSVCCTPAFGITHLPSIVKNYMADFSANTDFEFSFKTPEDAISGLQKNMYDIAAIEHLPELDLSSFSTLSLPQQEMVIISSPYLNLPEGMLKISDLLPHTFYIRTEGCSCRHLLERNLTRLDSDLGNFKNIITSDDLHLIVRSVTDSDSISFVSRSLADKLATEKVRQHYVEGFEHRRMLTIVRRPNNALCPAVATFMKGAQDYFETLESTNLK